MALRQQQQIDSQHQLLAAKEQRLRFLKAQEARGAAAAAEGERLRRLRERVEAQESKLRRLRALRGQVDLQKTYNVTLSKWKYLKYLFLIIIIVISLRQDQDPLQIRFDFALPDKVLLCVVIINWIAITMEAFQNNSFIIPRAQCHYPWVPL